MYPAAEGDKNNLNGCYSGPERVVGVRETGKVAGL
jgi:hypothetical protein